MSDKGKKKVATPPPAEPGATIVVVPPTPSGDGDNESDNEASEEIAALRERITALETRIAEVASGEEAWRATTITSLQQDLADLRATMETVSSNQSVPLTEVRDELTQLRQEIASLKAKPPVEEITEPVIATEIPPAVPPPHQSEKEDGQQGSHADSEPLNPLPAPGLKRKRVL